MFGTDAKTAWLQRILHPDRKLKARKTHEAVKTAASKESLEQPFFRGFYRSMRDPKGPLIDCYRERLRLAERGEERELAFVQSGLYHGLLLWIKSLRTQAFRQNCGYRSTHTHFPKARFLENATTWRRPRRALAACFNKRFIS